MILSDYLTFYNLNNFSYFPVPFKQKKPDILWGEYINRRPSTIERKMWSNLGETNIGVVCGQISDNLLVVDVDDAWVYHEVLAEHYSDTLTCETGSGYHIYLKTPNCYTNDSLKFSIHVEFKGKGRFVLVPPSTHPFGLEYEFINIDTPIKKEDNPINNIHKLLKDYIPENTTKHSDTRNGSKFVPPWCPGIMEDLKKANPSHLARFALVTQLAYTGTTEEEAYEWFKSKGLFDENDSMIRYQIHNIMSKPYHPPSCDRIKGWGLCTECDLYDREKEKQRNEQTNKRTD